MFVQGCFVAAAYESLEGSILGFRTIFLASANEILFLTLSLIISFSYVVVFESQNCTFRNHKFTICKTGVRYVYVKK